MKRKARIYGSLYCCVLFFSGCGLSSVSSETITDLHEPLVPDVNLKTIDKKSITNEKMKQLFHKYLIIDEETMLLLNQKPKQITTEYWEAYTAYQTKTKSLLGDYLSEDIENKLKKQYIHDDVDYMRLLEIDEFMLIGIDSIEDTEIISHQTYDNKNIYHVMVTAIGKVVNLNWANEKYKWTEDKGYYTQNLEYDLDTNPEEDLIKLNLNYWVETGPGEGFKINSIKEKSKVNLGIYEQRNAKNNYFISRVPYLNQVIESDKKKINKFLDTFMKQDYNFYTYYRKAHGTNYDILRMALESDLGLRGVVNLRKEDYKDYFKPSLIPLKDNMDVLTFDTEKDVVITPHILSSKRHQAYQVVVRANAVLLNGKEISYEYIYLFSFENDMIYSVRLIKQKEI